MDLFSVVFRRTGKGVGIYEIYEPVTLVTLFQACSDALSLCGDVRLAQQLSSLLVRHTVYVEADVS